jgi:hypothetical protein
MVWQEIKTPADADRLIHVFGRFHDSCIREAHLWTAHYVNASLSMTCAPSPDTSIRMLVQRQCENPSAIELYFELVIRFNLAASPENCDSIITGATLLVQDGHILWSTTGDWNLEMPNRDDFTWVSARKLRWREVDWLGQELRYGPGEIGNEIAKESRRERL